VSPSGLSYIGQSKELLGRIPAAIAIKRTHLDEAIAMTAKQSVYLLTCSSLYIFLYVYKKLISLWCLETL